MVVSVPPPPQPPLRSTTSASASGDGNGEARAGQTDRLPAGQPGRYPPGQTDRLPDGYPLGHFDGPPTGRTSGSLPAQTTPLPPGQTTPQPSGQSSVPPPAGGPKPSPNARSRGKSVGLIVGLGFAGLVAYSIVNAILGILIFVSTLDENGPNYPVIISCTIFLALFGLGAGAGLQFLRKPWATGLGVGFLVGWALWSILSAGICTGISPDLYA